MAKSKHDRISEQLAESEHTTYNRGRGPDVISKDRTIEVAVHDSDLYASVDQVKRFPKPYIATTRELIPKALKITKGTGVGVMMQNGVIVKKPRGK
jgi:hypothetical protein